MSDEENEAIIDFEREVEDGRILHSDIVLSLNTGVIILDLVKKQAKEREELREENIKLKNPPFFDEENYISKEELKEILGLEEGDDDSAKGILDYIKIIIEENARLEDIEDRKVQIEYNNVFNKGVKSVEDKIKAKIEELKKERNKLNFESDCMLIDDIDNKIEVLESLLEKE